MKVLLSIKPKYAKQIFDGTKKYEFRRSVFKNPKVKTVIVYASAPMKKVIGEFEIDFIMNYELDKLWNMTKKHSGISEEFFFEYFKSKEKGFAIKIKTTKKYNKHYSIKEKFGLFPPQSFAYLK